MASNRFTIGQHVSILAVSGLLAGLGLAGVLVVGFITLDRDQCALFANQEAVQELTHIGDQTANWLVTIDTIFVESETTSGALESSAIAQGRALVASTQGLANHALMQQDRAELLDVAASMQVLTKALMTLHSSPELDSDGRAPRERVEHLAAPLPAAVTSLEDHARETSLLEARLFEALKEQFRLIALATAGIFASLALIAWRLAQIRLSRPLETLVSEMNATGNADSANRLRSIDSANLQALSMRYKSMAHALEEAGKSNRVRQAETDALLESIPAILIALDPDGKIVLWNAAATQNFGLIPNQALTRSITEVPIPWVDSATPQSLLPEPAREDVRVIPEVAFTAADGERRFLNVTTTPVSYGAQGNGLLVLGTDTTEQRSLESRARHSQKLESVGQLAAGIAHEINTPIQYVGDSIHFLQEAFDDMHAILASYKDLRSCVKDIDSAARALEKVDEAEEEADLELLEEEVPGAIQRAIEGVNRVANIVGAMKRFAHPGAANFAPADLNEAVRTTLTVANNELRYIAKVNQQLGSIPAVECDLGDINQVLLNLLVNAAHAIEEKSDEKGTITVRTRLRDNRVIIEVSDTGCGIPSEAEGNVFDPFFTTKEVGKGTGQGLAIAHTIICEKHCGQLTFDSSPERGTTFYIELPVRQVVAA